VLEQLDGALGAVAARDDAGGAVDGRCEAATRPGRGLLLTVESGEKWRSARSTAPLVEVDVWWRAVRGRSP
jgi:hypothetical protein